jgi:hypothetical protein
MNNKKQNNRKKDYRVERARKTKLQNYYSESFEKFVDEFFTK